MLEDIKNSSSKENSDKEAEVMSKSEELEDKFRIPDHSSNVSKSRTNSEKSVNKNQKLTFDKLASTTSVTTQATPKVKDQAAPIEMIKESKSFEFTNASVQNNDHDFRQSPKGEEFFNSKFEMPSLSQNVNRVKNDPLHVDNSPLDLEAWEDLDSNFHHGQDYKDMDEYNDQDMSGAHPDVDKDKFDLSQRLLIDDHHQDADNQPLYGNYGNPSIDDLEHKDYYQYEESFLSNGFMNDPHHEDFHMASDLP